MQSPAQGAARFGRCEFSGHRDERQAGAGQQLEGGLERLGARFTDAAVRRRGAVEKPFGFRELLAASGGDMQRFYADVKALSAEPREAREAKLSTR